jgi:hypothetical protein
MLRLGPRCPLSLKENHFTKKWQTLHKRSFFFSSSIVCSLNCLFFFSFRCCQRAWCVTFQRKKLMMKTITDVVFCAMMTQYYMDEQIFEESSIWKGTPSSCDWDIYAFGNESQGLFNDRISGAYPEQMSRTRSEGSFNLHSSSIRQTKNLSFCSSVN